jgi:hypothetical protein
LARLAWQPREYDDVDEPSDRDTSGANTGSVTDFATGWDDHTLAHGRPAAVEYSSDGRLFVANDNNGEIFWIAPITP